MCWFFRKGQQGIVQGSSRLPRLSFNVLMATLTFLNCSRKQAGTEQRGEEGGITALLFSYYANVWIVCPPPPPVDRQRPSPFFSHYPPPRGGKERRNMGKGGIKRIKTYSIKFHSYATPQGRAHKQVFLVLLPPARRNPQKFYKKGKERMDERCQHGILGTFIPPFP